MRVVSPALVQAHRVFGGTCYGPRQLLLVDAPDARLMWVLGHQSYLGRMSGSSHVKSTLWLVRDDMSMSRRVVLQCEGRRLTPQLLQEDAVQAAVTAMWGEEVARALAVDATVILSPSETETARLRQAKGK